MKYVIEIECITQKAQWEWETVFVEFIEFDSLRKAIERAQAEYEYRKIVKEEKHDWSIHVYNNSESPIDDDYKKELLNGGNGYMVDFDGIWANGHYVGNILCCSSDNNYDEGFVLRDNTILFNRVDKAYEYMVSKMDGDRYIAMVDFKTEKVTFIQGVADYDY